MVLVSAEAFLARAQRADIRTHLSCLSGPRCGNDFLEYFLGLDIKIIVIITITRFMSSRETQLEMPWYLQPMRIHGGIQILLGLALLGLGLHAHGVAKLQVDLSLSSVSLAFSRIWC